MKGLYINDSPLYLNVCMFVFAWGNTLCFSTQLHIIHALHIFTQPHTRIKTRLGLNISKFWPD